MIFLRRREFATLLLFGFVFPYLAEASPVPVVLELFASDQNCSDCRYAVDAVRSLQKKYPTSQMIPLIYHLNDPLMISPGQARAKNPYKISVYPTAVFAGSSLTPGANSKIVNAYDHNIANKLGRTSAWTLRSYYNLQDNRMISTVHAERTTLSSSPADLYCCLIPAPDGSGDFVVRGLAQAARVTDRTAQTYAVFPDLGRYGATPLTTLWFLQDASTHEILQAAFSTPEPDLSRDLNGDGRVSADDLYLFSTCWKSNGSLADFTQDSVVDGLDLLFLLNPAE